MLRNCHNFLVRCVWHDNQRWIDGGRLGGDMLLRLYALHIPERYVEVYLAISIDIERSNIIRLEALSVHGHEGRCRQCRKGWRGWCIGVRGVLEPFIEIGHFCLPCLDGSRRAPSDL